MELFLKQLKVYYVVTESCPEIPVSPPASLEEVCLAKSGAQMWMNDDYICRHSILNSLCHVSNYIQFQMIDGVSVVEQVEQLHRIADSVTASGIHIDENFHYIPLDRLIYWLKDEEDSRSTQQQQ
ncbi:unnamed protein product [Lactuca saligna]|uniref:Uncharacterized protein n=1 Tax=Lactuca saligna TaxID=75948 RepID=A0AA36EDG0_LACSI|nr:unnamed protein product [Lactuca saligna]